MRVSESVFSRKGEVAIFGAFSLVENGRIISKTAQVSSHFAEEMS